MVIYLTTLVLAVLICRKIQENSRMILFKNRGNLYANAFVILLILLLGGVVGWRKGVGTDYGNYIDIYLLSDGLTISQAFEKKEPLFGILNSLCAKWFDDYVPVFVICGIVTCALIVYGIKHSSTKYWLSVFLFITGMYYFDLFNGMRQMVATAIMFAAYPWAVKRKWIPVCICTLIAYGFHTSASVVLIVFLFATYVRLGSTSTILLVIGFGVVYLNYNVFANILIQTLNSTDSSYSIYEKSLSQLDQGANFLRFALASVPVVFGLYSWRILKEQREDAGILLNISLINALFMLISTRNWIFARFSMFFGIYNILLWPELLKCFNKKSSQIVLAGVLAVYLLYFWLIVHVDSNLLPYKSWLFWGIYD